MSYRAVERIGLVVIGVCMAVEGVQIIRPGVLLTVARALPW